MIRIPDSFSFAGYCLPRYFANEAAPADATGQLVAFHLANESAATGESWVMLAPYGDWDNAGGMQRFARADADTIVNEFVRLANLPQRLLGLPWYVGHPDHHRFADKYKDTRAYGRIKKLEARDDGLFANVKWSEAGRDLIQSEAFHGHSVNWRVVEERPGIFRPISLKSVGFTNDPQIPVAPAMANETGATTPTMNPELIALLAALGQTITADASADAVSTAAKAALAKYEESKAAATTADKAKADADTALANERAAHAATKGTLGSVETLLANERKDHVKQLLDTAERAGIISPAERPKWETEFANEMAGPAARLAALKPGLKTSAYARDLAARQAAATSSTDRRKVRELVNERMKAKGEDYDAAFRGVQREHGQLFANMKQPGA